MTAETNNQEAARGEFVIRRTFEAPRELVRKTWSEPEHLMQWFGPKGFTMPIAKRDFRPGGMFHDCMHSPDGKKMLGRFVYREIVAPERIAWVNPFSDEKGGITRHPFSSAAWPMEMLFIHHHSRRGGRQNEGRRPLVCIECNGRGAEDLRRFAREHEDGLDRNLRSTRRISGKSLRKYHD